MMHGNPIAIPSTSRRHGPCQQCGWTQSLRKLTMHQFADLRRIRPRFLGGKWICDECFASAGLVEKGTESTVRDRVVPSPVPPARHRSVA